LYIWAFPGLFPKFVTWVRLAAAACGAGPTTAVRALTAAAAKAAVSAVRMRLITPPELGCPVGFGPSAGYAEPGHNTRVPGRLRPGPGAVKAPHGLTARSPEDGAAFALAVKLLAIKQLDMPPGKFHRPRRAVALFLFP